MSLRIEKKPGENAEILLVGRLDTTTAPELEALLDELLPAAQTLVMDLNKLEYISSAGLRLILKAQKAMSRKGGMRLKNVPAPVMEVFDITGFADFLSIENGIVNRKE